MSFLLTCPYCLEAGPRPVEEFRCSGEVTRRPRPHADAARARRRTSTSATTSPGSTASGGTTARLRDLVPRRARHGDERGGQDRGSVPDAPRRAAAGADRPVAGRSAFTYEGQPIRGFAGDTIGSALFAAGRRMFSRSFKYHRPRGLLCCTGHCPNCLMTVDGIPNVRVVHDARSRRTRSSRRQNVLGSLDRDWMSVTDKLGGPFTPPGFYYKTFIRPKRLLAALREVPAERGGARPARSGRRSASERFDVEHRHVDMLVIGGGRSGLEAAIDAARRGDHVALVDEGPEPGGDLLAEPGRSRRGACARRPRPRRPVSRSSRRRARSASTRAASCPVEHGRLLIRFRAEHVVGGDGHDGPAPRLPRQRPRRRDVPDGRSPARQLLVAQAGRPRGRARRRRSRPHRDRGPSPRRRLDRRPRRLPRATAALDRREGPQGARPPGDVDGKSIDCDLARHGRKPPARLPAARQRGRDGRATTPTRGIFVPTELPATRVGGRQRHGRRRRGGLAAADARRGQRLLRLLLRGSDRRRT